MVYPARLIIDTGLMHILQKYTIRKIEGMSIETYYVSIDISGISFNKHTCTALASNLLHLHLLHLPEQMIQIIEAHEGMWTLI